MRSSLRGGIDAAIASDCSGVRRANVPRSVYMKLSNRAHANAISSARPRSIRNGAWMTCHVCLKRPMAEKFTRRKTDTEPLATQHKTPTAKHTPPKYTDRITRTTST